MNKDNLQYVDDILRSLTPIVLTVAGTALGLASVLSPIKNDSVQIAGVTTAGIAFGAAAGLGRSPNDKKQGVGDGANIENLEIK